MDRYYCNICEKNVAVSDADARGTKLDYVPVCPDCGSELTEVTTERGN